MAVLAMKTQVATFPRRCELPVPSPDNHSASRKKVGPTVTGQLADKPTRRHQLADSLTR